MATATAFPELTAEEAALRIPHQSFVGVSGFTGAGSAKTVTRALAKRAAAMHAAGEPFSIRLISGASTGKSVDDALAKANAVSWRTPYQSSRELRNLINKGQVDFVDMHLSHVPQQLTQGVYGKLDYAIVEITDVTPDGKVYLSTSIGMSPTMLLSAKKIFLEWNHYHSPRLREMADILVLPRPPHRDPIPIHHVLSRVGKPYVQVDPDRIVGIIHNNEPDEMSGFSPPDKISMQIAEHVIKFLNDELSSGRIPAEFLPLQSGVGNVANAVMMGLGAHPDVPPFAMYTEVFQDALVDLMLNGNVTAASAAALAVSPEALQRIYSNMDFFAPKVILRPQEISNHPAVARQLGVIAMNTALEVDIYGHVNSTHVAGTELMNGIGGSGDFERNAYVSFFLCPSFAKGGKISTFVPMCSHVDHNEHSVQIIVTEHGLADLRGKAPVPRARLLIENCAHPAFRPYLFKYLESGRSGHIRHDLSRCFELHQNLIQHGAMLPDLDLSQFSET